MIVVDTSALLAVLQAEKEGEEFLDVLVHNRLYLPASVLVEINIVAPGRALTKDLRELVANLRAEVIALDSGIASFAIDAFRRFGKGRHKASLNFGDCLVYATAKQLDLPLLYKGRDFLYTDLKSAIRARQ
jgi:ribonuclease VapC